jgi:NUMOD4 motif
VRGYETYSVSSFGRVRNDRTRIVLKPKSNKHGYSCIYLYRTGDKQKYVKIHRLVGSAFLENVSNLPQINHKNGVKTCNHLENIEWSSAKDNMLHAYRTGLKFAFVDHLKIRVSQYTVDGEFVATYDSLADAAKAVGLKSMTTISHVLHGRRETSAGFVWRYADTVKVQNVDLMLDDEPDDAPFEYDHVAGDFFDEEEEEDEN